MISSHVRDILNLIRMFYFVIAQDASTLAAVKNSVENSPLINSSLDFLNKVCNC